MVKIRDPIKVLIDIIVYAIWTVKMAPYIWRSMTLKIRALYERRFNPSNLYNRRNKPIRFMIACIRLVTTGKGITLVIKDLAVFDEFVQFTFGVTQTRKKQLSQQKIIDAMIKRYRIKSGNIFRAESGEEDTWTFTVPHVVIDELYQDLVKAERRNR